MRKILLSLSILVGAAGPSWAEGSLTGSSVSVTEAIANASSATLAPASTFGSTSIGWGANTMTLSSDSLGYRGQNYVSTLHLDHNFGGADMTGSRAGLDVSMVMRGTSSNRGNASQYYVGIADYVQCGFNDNGSAGLADAAGSCVAVNPIADLGGGSFWYTLNAEEVDVRSAPGSSSAHTFGTLSVKSGAGPRGTYDDAALAFASGTGSPSWSTLIQVGKSDGTAPTAADTKLIACARNVATDAPCALGAGVDLRDFAISGAAFASPGFSVDGAGHVAAGSLAAARVTAPEGAVGSIVLDTQAGGYTTAPVVVIAPPPSGIEATAVVSSYGLSQWAVVSGGTGYRVNDVLSLGGGPGESAALTPAKVRVTAVDGAGAITATSGLDGGSFPAPPLASAAASGGSGGSAQFSMTAYVKAVAVTSGGSGYTSAPAVVIAGATGGGTAAHAVLGATSSGVLIGAFVRSSDPTPADIPSGQCADWNNTATGSYKHVCNFGGALRSAAMD